MTDYTYSPGHSPTANNYPLIGNPHQHFYTTRNMPILLAVNHITAGLDDFDGKDSSAEATLSYSSATATVASYHGIVDSDSILDALPDTYTAFAQGVIGHSFNSPSLALEVGKRSTDWRKAPVVWKQATLANMAKWWAPRVKRYNLPIYYELNRDVIDQKIAARAKVGFTDHYILSPGTRSDPGLYGGVNTFPRADFLQAVRDAVKALDTAPPSPPPVVVDAPNVPSTQKTKTVQLLLRLPADGYWGTNTETRAALMRSAAWKYAADPARPVYVPSVNNVQSILGVAVDGIMGPISVEMLHSWVKRLQIVIGVKPDGWWGPSTDAAYLRLRNANLNKF
jgi:murein L,D-transpeptidase YcbB/YkuD